MFDNKKINVDLSESVEFILRESCVLDDYKHSENANFYINVDIKEYDGVVFILREKREDGDIDSEIDTCILIELLLKAENVEIDTELYREDELMDMVDEWIDENIDDKVAFLFENVYYEIDNDILEKARNVMVFNTKNEAGQYFINAGFFGEINEKLQYYIDYEKMVDDMSDVIPFRGGYYYFSE